MCFYKLPLLVHYTLQYYTVTTEAKFW